MKFVLILCEKVHNEKVMKLLESQDIHGYTEVPMVLGAGVTGKRMDTRIFPGSGCLLFTLVERQKADALVRALKDFGASLLQGEGFRVFSMDADILL